MDEENQELYNKKSDGNEEFKDKTEKTEMKL